MQLILSAGTRNCDSKCLVKVSYIFHVPLTNWENVYCVIKLSTTYVDIPTNDCVYRPDELYVYSYNRNLITFLLRDILESCLARGIGPPIGSHATLSHDHD